jgi:hypothetical protein
LKKEQPKGKRTWCPLSVPANKKNLSSIRWKVPTVNKVLNTTYAIYCSLLTDFLKSVVNPRSFFEKGMPISILPPQLP